MANGISKKIIKRELKTLEKEKLKVNENFGYFMNKVDYYINGVLEANNSNDGRVQEMSKLYP